MNTKKMTKAQKIRKAEKLVDSIERKLDRCRDSDKVVSLSEAWDKANDRLMDLMA